MSAVTCGDPNPRWEPTPRAKFLMALAHNIKDARTHAVFLAACELDAIGHGGFVSVNRVRTLTRRHDIPPRQYSALWCRYTGDGRPMQKVKRYEVCSGSASGNDGRPMPLRRWDPDWRGRAMGRRKSN